MIDLRPNTYKIYVDCVIETDERRTVNYEVLTNNNFLKSTADGTIVYCHNRKPSAESTDNGVLVIKVGSNWQTLTGVNLKQLPKCDVPITCKLTNCTIDNNAITITADQSYTATITPNEGMEFTELYCEMSGKRQLITNGTINIAKVNGPIVVTATAKKRCQVLFSEPFCFLTRVNEFKLIEMFDGVTYADESCDFSVNLDPGYKLTAVSYTMNGVEYRNDKNKFWEVSIPKVTGDIELHVEYTRTMWFVNYNLTNCTTSNTNRVAAAPDGKEASDKLHVKIPFTTTITPVEGHDLSSITCTMGGVEQSIVDGTINIDDIIGDIVITATATPSQP